VWEPVLPALERERDVLALTLAGHAGGPELPGEITEHTLADAVERAMADAGFELARIAGNSLGGFVALQLAERGRASSVVAFAPAGGWERQPHVFALQREMHDAFRRVPAYLDRRAAGAAAIDAPRMLAFAERARWEIDAERITCPVRFVWGTEDELLPWPDSAARYRKAFPHADWIELDGVGHHPQIDVPLEAAQLIL
jgi:pimeloyl-ACP methyl ester carboxylesterase